MNTPQPPQVIRFAAYELDLHARELCKDGRSTGLPDQSITILTMLLDQPGTLVLREDIRTTLWPNDTIVEFDHSINTAIGRLRQALGDSAEKPRFVETLPRRGYRWIGPAISSEDREQIEKTPALVVEPTPLHTPDSTLIGKKVSHYRVLEVLGGGGMGVVYKAEDLKLGRRVALKFLPEEIASDVAARQRFESEARSASALNHPNICTIYGVEEFEGQPFLAMELLQGQTLRDLIGTAPQQKPPLTLSNLLDLSVQIIAGLEAAHKQGIIHRDIKPANIFVTAEGQAKILDFGLAKLALSESTPENSPITDRRDEHNSYLPAHEAESLTASSPFLSRTGVAMGTAGYMSPEQVRGEKLDARTDLFSFGLVLYEMATGKRAFSGSTGPELQEAILTQMPSPARKVNPELPEQLCKIVDHALEKIREARYQSASEMRADLESLKEATEPRHRIRWQTMAAVSIVVLFLATVAFWFVKRRLQSASAMPPVKIRQLTSNSSENSVGVGAISPDGKYLAFIDRVGIHIKLIETGETRIFPQPVQLNTDQESLNDIVSWFPDGTRLLANSHPRGADASEWTSQGSGIWIVSLSGGPPQRIIDEAVAYSISPDGSLISFGKNRNRIGDREIWVMRPDGEQTRKVFDVDENHSIGGLTWSPDGQRVIYVQAEGSPNNFVFVSGDLNGGPLTTILPPFDTKLNSGVIWLPDGRLIYNLGEWGSMYTCNLWQARMDPRMTKFIEKPQRITSLAGICANPVNATSDSKRLAYSQWRPNTNVYVAELQARGTRLSTPTRLTMEQSWNEPFAWTADSKSVIFYSNRRTDVSVLFKQRLDQDFAEPLVTGKAGEDPDSTGCLSPDGAWVIYVLSSEKAAGKLMRVPVMGGSPQLVLTASTDGGPRCARYPATLCAIAERSADRKQLVFSALDPVNGRGRKLAEWKTDVMADFYWDLSSDGTRIAVLKKREGRFQILSLNGRAPQDITVKGWKILSSVNWTADGKGLLVSSFEARGAVLLNVDLHGNASPLWEQPGGIDTWGVPSPDGRHIAMRAWNVESNLWLMENF